MAEQRPSPLHPAPPTDPEHRDGPPRIDEPVTKREATASFVLVVIASVLTLITFVTWVTLPLCILAWVAVGASMIVRRVRISRERKQWRESGGRDRVLRSGS
jgi:uncharacterized membrane protein YgcG